MCSWTTAYKFLFVGGDKMSAPDFVQLPAGVAPGQTVDVSVSLVAPDAPGTYQGFWELQSPEGDIFGVGSSADRTVWAKVNVVPPPAATSTPAAVITSTATPPQTAPAANVTYDFVDRACAAQWQGNDGALPCPGEDGDAHGFVLTMTQARLEDGTVASLPTLLTFPQFSGSGYIQGTYPEYQVHFGDHLQATVGCEADAASCSVLFRISYQDASGAVNDLWTFGEFYDGKYFNLDLDLSPLAGRSVKFILKVSSLGSPVEDRALWAAPRIVRFPPATPTATGSPTSVATPTSTHTPLPTFTATRLPAPSPTPAGQAPSPFPSLSGIIDNIISFFRHLFGK
jgi:Ig-like domain-containing protein